MNPETIREIREDERLVVIERRKRASDAVDRVLARYIQRERANLLTALARLTAIENLCVAGLES